MSKANRTLKNIFTVGAFTSLSRVLGLVREMLQSRLIGAGVAQSAFTLAFAIPNMARKLFGEGALTAAFVPVFKSEVEAEAFESARRLARAVMSMSLMMLSAVVALVFIGCGFAESCEGAFAGSERMQLTFSLVKTLLPYMIFICGAAFGMGVLNALGRFKAASAMPCILNVFWIGILVWIWFNPGTDVAARVKTVAWAILAAGAAQFAFMLWRMHASGYTPGFTFRGWRDEKVRIVWRNTVIAAVGAGAVQINCMLDQVLAQKASPWAAGVIGYAERLMDLPLGVIGVAFGTVLLPTFSGFFARGDVNGAKSAFSSSLTNMMLLMLPASAGLFILAPEVTSVIYEGNAFDSTATVRVSRALAVYSLGLAFFGYQKSIVPWFQAQKDVKTPLAVAVKTVFLNAFLNVLAVFLLPVEWRHVGLAASTVFCSAVGGVMLTVMAVRRNGALGFSSAVPRLLRIAAATVLMAAALCFAKDALADLPLLVRLSALVAAGAAVFAFSALALGLRRCVRVRGK